MVKRKIKTGDDVIVITGKYRGQKGKVLSVDPTAGKVVVDGVNVVKKHTKPDMRNPSGGIIEKTLPIDISNVAMADKDGTPTKVGYKLLADGKKVRFARKSGEVI